MAAVNDQEDENVPGMTPGCPICGGPHDANPDDCPILLSRLIYEKGMKFPKPRPFLPPPKNDDQEDDGN